MQDYILYAGGIKHLTDARYFAARGFHWVGLQTDSGLEGSLTLAGARAVSEWIEGPKIAIEPGFAEDPAAFQALQETWAAGILAEGFIPAGLADRPDIKLFIKINSDDADLLATLKYVPRQAYIIIPPALLAKSGDSFAGHQLLLDITAFSSEDLQAWQVDPAICGFYTGGGDEEATGLKSFDQVDEKLDILEDLIGGI